MEKRITTPLTEAAIAGLKAGDIVLITGVIYTARDSAHKKIVDAIEKGEEIPFDLKDQIIYYVGPTPEKPGEIFGSAGPTTSSRMDKFTPILLEKGLKGMIGKGVRNKEVEDSIIKNKAVYFGAIGGLGATIGKSVKKTEVIAYEELGTEAVRKLYVEDLPVTVLTDSKGNDLYKLGQAEYLKWSEENEDR